MAALRLFHPNGCLKGTIRLSGSKSISNRVLLIQAIAGMPFPISNLSDSDDTRVLQHLLQSNDELLDADHAGTSFRFMTALLAFGEKKRMLTGSERMKQRPIGVLVDALRSLGARITYAEKEGYPPLIIEPGTLGEVPGQVTLDAGVSSQFISSLMMIAPTLPGGLVIHLDGNVVSAPYIGMTKNVMASFGVECKWEGSSVSIPAASYQPGPFHVEADWSAASYYYTMAALSREADITLLGLFEKSMQGDAEISQICGQFGVHTEFIQGGIRIRKEMDARVIPFFEKDFISIPDLAQSVFVMMAGLGCPGLFTGLHTLKMKETDRIQALQAELAKTQVFLSRVPDRFSKANSGEIYMLEGKALQSEDLCFHTYQDHRMAMALAALGSLFPVSIDDPGVVSKSYPAFWNDIATLGFSIEWIS
jgi:3-phosphoshikimate 1-carboxyvinyltransferase